ncbi:MAG TPA: hypothetical protein VGK67_28780 [Myxococcales bacterium]|jgi:hypothetical protein
MPTSALVLLLAALSGQAEPAPAEVPATGPSAAAPAPAPARVEAAQPAAVEAAPVEPAPPAQPATPATVDEPLSDPARLTLIGSPEVNLVGLSYGLRLELDYRPFEPGTVSRFRLAVAFDYGAEFFYLPVALGYRAVFRQSGTVRPLVGLGLELQSFFITDAPTIRKVTGFLEGGVLFAFDAHWEAGLVASLEYAPSFSPGLCARLQIGHTF